MHTKPIPSETLFQAHSRPSRQASSELASIRIRALLVATFMLSPAVNAFAKGQTSSPNNFSLQQQCAEETAQAEHWIRWASETKRDCIANHTNPTDRQSCLIQAKKQLLDLEREHAAVYTSQISSLPPNHPIVINLIKKLRNNADAAQVAIDSEQEPTQISLLRQEQCLSQR